MPRNNKKFALFWPALLLLTSLACGLAGEATPTLLPAATETPESTATTAPQLSYVNHEEAELGVSFRYPDTWQIELDDSSIVVASEPALLNTQQFDREGAGALITVGGPELFAGDTLEEALSNAVQQLNFTGNDRIVEGPQRTTINGQEAVTARVEGSNPDSSQTLVVLVTLLRHENRVAFIAGVTLQSVLQQYRDVLETIAQSVVLARPPAGDVQAMGVLQYGETVAGRIEAGNVATWTFIGVEGERIDLTVRPLQETLDLSIDIQDASGASILPGGPVDDSFGVETIRGLALPASAEYTVWVSGFAQASGDFELAIGEAGALTSAQSIAVGDTVNGSLELDEQDDYLFDEGVSTAVTVVVNPVGDLDVVLEILDSSGSVIFQEDSSYGQEQLSFTPTATESYILRVRGFAGAAGDYAIALQAGGVGSTGTTLTTTASLDTGDAEGHNFPFRAEQNDVVQAIVTPEGEFDLIVEVWNDDTDELEETIDASYGREQVNFAAPQTGNYFFKILGFEGQGGTYTIALSGSPRVIFELLPGDQVSGDMGDSAGIDYYIRLDPGEAINANVVPDGETDVVVEILNRDENWLAGIDDGFAGEPEQLSFTAPAGEGEGVVYILRIRNFSAEAGGTFSLTLE